MTAVPDRSGRRIRPPHSSTSTGVRQATINRRQFTIGTVASAGAVLLSQRFAGVAMAAGGIIAPAPGGWYTPNVGALKPAAFLRLPPPPPQSVTPGGWNNPFADPRQGFETCGIVEMMASHEMMVRMTGDPIWADRCEELAFNMLPATLDPNGKGVRYITSANMVGADDTLKSDLQFQNERPLQAYKSGVEQYRCCPHNYGMGWPWFLQESWVATPSKGLAAVMYGPNEVTAKVGSAGSTVTITQTTNYPFDDTITFTVKTSSPVAFPLVLRIPAWCSAPQLTVAGASRSVSGGPNFVTIGDRTWQNGDTVVLKLPQKVTVKTWTKQQGAVSVYRGPLAYSLEIGESYYNIADGNATTQFPTLGIRATTDWNYALVGGLTPTEDAKKTLAAGADPFVISTTPYRLTAKARQLKSWGMDGQKVVWPLQKSPALTTEAVKDVKLIPMGAARLRVSVFPTASTTGTPWLSAGWYFFRNRNSGRLMSVNNASTQPGAIIQQFENNGTADHLWELVPDGENWYRIRNKNSGLVLATPELKGGDGQQMVQSQGRVGDERGANPGNATDLYEHHWKLIPVDATGYKIQNLWTGKMLSVQGASKENFGNVIVNPDSSSAPDQIWEIVRPY